MTLFESAFARRARAAALLTTFTATFAGGLGEAAAQSSPPPRVAEGNGAGMDLHLFRPAVDSKGFFSVNGADVLGHKDLSFGLVLDYGHALLPTNPGHGADYLVEHALQGTFQFDVGLANFLVLGVSAPIVVNGGETALDVGAGPGKNANDTGLNAQALGNVAVHAKVRILRPDGPVGLALIGQAGYGVGETRNFASEPGFFYWPQAVVEFRVGGAHMFRAALNGGYRGHTGANPTFGLGEDGKSQLKSGVFTNGNLLTGGLGLSFRILPALDLTAETYTTYELGAAASDARQKLSAEALGGIKLFVDKNSYFMLGAGAGYTPGFESAGQRVTLGFIFEPAKSDRDGDGIRDDDDDCPDDAEDFDGFQDTKADSPPGEYGCPDPDNDKDGIPDVADKCPNDPEDRDGYQDDDGCPEANDGDRDGDGILDSHDKCPDVAEDKDGFEDEDGCPDPDNDKDGIPDIKDRCPNDPEDKDGVEDEDGCPEPDADNDRDKDGILDAVDKCPDQPETFNGFEDEDGCPDKGKVVIEENNILILDKILFKTGSAEILKASFSIVDAVATTLTHHAEFTLIEVSGHADERGQVAMNLQLTQERVNAVVEALVKRGVKRQSLRATGYGPYCPLDATHNAAAWEKNRRVEFKVVTGPGGSTGVTLGCEKSQAAGVGAQTP
jgi:outer membrane protein OmpA-like peptidoglycan-associated protein